MSETTANPTTVTGTTATKPTVKRTTAKKSAAKRPVTRKTTAKKSAAKKPVTRKTTAKKATKKTTTAKPTTATKSGAPAGFAAAAATAMGVLQSRLPFDLPTIDLSKVLVSGVEIPRIDMSKISLPKIDMNAFEGATRAQRDAVRSRMTEVVDTVAAATISAPARMSLAMEDIRGLAEQATIAVREALPL